jgi:peptidoglycan/LPS O-acetylase OafA/YrhL
MQHQDRFHALDALRAFALLLGVFFHAAMSFIVPYAQGLQWAIADNSSSGLLALFVGITHSFRMPLFFFIAGFFAHLLYHRRGPAEFAANRAKRIVLPLVVGWCVMTVLLGLIWWWGYQKSGTPLPPSEMDWTHGEVRLTHLWFLYYLTLAYVTLVGIRHLVVDRIDADGRLRSGIDKVLQTMIEQRWAPLALSLPLAIAAAFAPQWLLAGGMPTPDRSLIPELIPSVGYGVMFTVGWLFHRNPGLLQILTERSGFHMGLAGICMVLGFAASAGMLLPQPFATLFRCLTALFATALTWSLVFALIGYALRKFSSPSPAIRYVADASYWIYIAHLPVVCALQVWVAYWPLHWTLKYSFIMIVSFAVLFASYHYLVRYTVVGAVLNGRKYRQSAAPSDGDSKIVASP